MFPFMKLVSLSVLYHSRSIRSFHGFSCWNTIHWNQIPFWRALSLNCPCNLIDLKSWNKRQHSSSTSSPSSLSSSSSFSTIESLGRQINLNELIETLTTFLKRTQSTRIQINFREPNEQSIVGDIDQTWTLTVHEFLPLLKELQDDNQHGKNSNFPSIQANQEAQLGTHRCLLHGSSTSEATEPILTLQWFESRSGSPLIGKLRQRFSDLTSAETTSHRAVSPSDAQAWTGELWDPMDVALNEPDRDPSNREKH